MKVTETTPKPVERTFTVEMTAEELRRLYLLSYRYEGGPCDPRLWRSVPWDIAVAAQRERTQHWFVDPGGYR